MTREQKIIELCGHGRCKGMCCNCDDAIRAAILSEMADWALSHQWVSVEDEMPPKIGRYSKDVIMLSRTGGRYTGCYDFVAKKWLDGHLEDILYVDITHWMPIPPMAEGGGEK